MGWKLNYLLVFLQAVLYCQAQQTCQLTDSNCLKITAQSLVEKLVEGIPELGTEKLDPLQVEQIKVDISGLKLNVKNAEITGLKSAVIEKLSVDSAKKHMKLRFHADLVLTGKYKASGRLLILPITGDGDTVMKLKNCQVEIDMTFDIVKNQDGNEIIELKNYEYNYDVKKAADFRLSNLFNGNKPLSDAMHQFMNMNWSTLILEFGKPMFDVPVDKIFNSIKTFLKTSPLKA